MWSLVLARRLEQIDEEGWGGTHSSLPAASGGSAKSLCNQAHVPICSVIGLLFEKLKWCLENSNLCIYEVRSSRLRGWTGRVEGIKQRCLRRANVGSNLITFQSVTAASEAASLYQRDKEQDTVQWKAVTLWTSRNPLLTMENQWGLVSWKWFV